MRTSWSNSWKRGSRLGLAAYFSWDPDAGFRKLRCSLMGFRIEDQYWVGVSEQLLLNYSACG